MSETEFARAERLGRDLYFMKKERDKYKKALKQIVEHWSNGIPNPEWMGILAEEALENTPSQTVSKE
jgi:hypothetical protein